MSNEVIIPLKNYLDTLTINGFVRSSAQKKVARKQIETMSQYPYPLISLAVTQGNFKIK